MADPAGATAARATSLVRLADYWEERHRTRHGLVSGGRIDVDHAGNEIFLAIRIGHLLSLIGDVSSRTEPLFILDAGCGKGAFARALTACGHRVDGFDRSTVAIEHARTAGGGPRYAVAKLTEWTSPWLYDVVISVDVLFHIVDDEEWDASLRNLASLVRLTGSLIIADDLGRDRRVLADYIVHRPRSVYDAVLHPLGLEFRAFVPYGFRDSAVGFLAYTRIS